MTLVSELKGDLCIVTNALQKIKKDDKKIDEEEEDDEEVQNYLLKEITNLSRRNSDTLIDCKVIDEEGKEQNLDPKIQIETDQDCKIPNESNSQKEGTDKTDNLVRLEVSKS